MVSRRNAVGILGLVSLLVVVLAFSQAGIADSHTGIIETEVETDYNGIEDGNQAITTVATFQAEQEIDELRIDISGSSNTFVEYQSIQPSVQGEGVGITSTDRRGEYVVEDLQPGQSITIQFDSYPRRLDQSETEAAVIQLSAENPRTLDYTTEPIVDTSSSPFLELQRTVDELANLQRDLDRVELFDTVTTVGMALGVLIGLGGIGAAVVFKRKESEWKEDAYENAADEVRTFQRNVNFSNDTIDEECGELISRLERKAGGLIVDTTTGQNDNDTDRGDTGSETSKNTNDEDIFD